MIPKEEWQRVKESLRKPATPEAMREAAEAMRRYEEAKKKNKSRPTLVNLGFRRGYPSSVPEDKIADEIERNPQFFELMRDIAESD